MMRMYDYDYDLTIINFAAFTILNIDSQAMVITSVYFSCLNLKNYQ